MLETDCSCANAVVLVGSLHRRVLEETIGSSHKYTGRALLPYRVLQGVWIDAILRRIADATSATANRVVLVKNVGNTNVDWSLGAALYYSG